MVYDSIQMQGVGLGLAVVGATAFSWLLKVGFAVRGELAVGNVELTAIRFSPSILSVVVGMAAGAAGSFSLATKGQVTIVGVMVAAALIPAAATADIGFAWGRLAIGAGNVVLLTMTIVAVNFGAYLTFKYEVRSQGGRTGSLHHVGAPPDCGARSDSRPPRRRGPRRRRRHLPAGDLRAVGQRGDDGGTPAARLRRPRRRLRHRGVRRHRPAV